MPDSFRALIVDGTLDVRLLRVSDSTIRIDRCSQRGRRGRGLEGL